MKIMAHLSIDPFVYETARLKYPKQLSSLVNQYLKMLINKPDNEIDTLKLNNEIIELEKEIATKKLEIEIQNNKEVNEEKLRNKEEFERKEKEAEVLRRHNPLRYL